MKRSVIIPAFNEEKLLPGVLAQAFAALGAHAAPDWFAEVILCDNNSTDRTAALARAAGAAGLRPVREGEERTEPVERLRSCYNPLPHIGV